MGKIRGFTRFGVLRHATTTWNVEGRIQGHLDSPLTAAGAAMARDWGRRFASGAWDRILSSDLGRAQETARWINQTLSLPVALDPGLREIDWGEWTGVTQSLLKELWPGEIQIQERRGWELQAPQGESREGVWERCRNALAVAAARYPGERVLVITHEGVIKCLIYRLLGRRYLPSEPAILLPRHLHHLIGDGQSLCILDLNAMGLEPES